MIQLTLTLKVTTAQVVETSVTVTDDQTQPIYFFVGFFVEILHVTLSCKESTVNILLKAPLRWIEEQEVYAVPVFSRAEAAEVLREYQQARESVMLKVVPWVQAGRQNQLDSLSDPTVLGRRVP